MTVHKNVRPFFKKCEAIITKYKGGGRCKKWASYAVIRLGELRYYCTVHYDLNVGHEY